MQRNKTTIVKIIIAISIVTVMALFYIAYRQNGIETAKSISLYNKNMRKISALVAGNAEVNFLTIDQTLQRATEKQTLNDLYNPELRNDARQNLNNWVNKTPHIDAMLITDENGLVQMLFRKGENNFDVRSGFLFSAKDHFNYHKTHPEQKILISTLKKNEQALNSRIFVSRRYEKPDGTFGGLAVAVMDSNYLINFLDSIDAGADTEIYMMLNDDDFLASNVPDSNSKLALIKAMMSESGFDKAPDGATVVAQRKINDSLNMFSFQRLEGLPITISIIAPEKDILLSWREERMRLVVVILVFILFAGMITAFAAILARKMYQAKEAEKKARGASQAKTDFLAKMSHELRTPLNAIIGFSEMLSSGYFGKISPTQQERLTDINLCGTHLLDLISDILEFSKADAGKLTLNEEEADMYNIVRQVMRMIEQRATNKGVDILNTVSRDAPTLIADSRKIKQILLNLLSNSIKFTNSGGKITISTYFDKNLNFVITVSDTGIGISKQDLPKAMAVFEQVGSDNNEGTGLGLPLCKILTELHGGHFWLESTVNVGTKAFITMPAFRVKTGQNVQYKNYRPLVNAK